MEGLRSAKSPDASGKSTSLTVRKAGGSARKSPAWCASRRPTCLTSPSFVKRAPYDAIFCRNALIYFDERARREVVSGMRELLHEDGAAFHGTFRADAFLRGGICAGGLPAELRVSQGRTDRGMRASGRSPAATASRRCGPARNHGTAGGAPGRQPVHGKPAPLPNRRPGLEQAEHLADRGELDAATAICERLLAEGAQNPDVYALLGVISESAGKSRIGGRVLPQGAVSRSVPLRIVAAHEPALRAARGC